MCTIRFQNKLDISRSLIGFDNFNDLEMETIIALSNECLHKYPHAVQLARNLRHTISEVLFEYDDVCEEENIKSRRKIKKNLHILPNPASSHIIIEGAQSSTITITNAVGQIVMTITDYEEQYLIDISIFQSGMYYISDGVQVTKFIKI